MYNHEPHQVLLNLIYADLIMNTLGILFPANCQALGGHSFLLGYRMLSVHGWIHAG